MAVASFNEFANSEALAEALSCTVAKRLLDGVDDGQFASLALSGGSTPRLFLEKLGEALGEAAEMVYIAPVDERFVPASDERSNEGMIRRCMGLGNHPDSEFLTMWREGMEPTDVAKLCHDKLVEDDELPFNVLTLGMGLDGHTASFFPGSPQLGNVVSERADWVVEAVTAPGAPEPRLTLTLPAVISAQHIVLHMEGAEKRAVYERALAGTDIGEMPVRGVLNHPDADVHVYWCP